MDAQQLAETSFWVDQYAAASEDVTTKAMAAARDAWLSFDGWYNERLVSQLAAELASLSRSSQHVVTGMSSQYVANVVASLRQARLEIPPIDAPVIRNGADLLRVHTRPAEVFRKAVALGADEQAALEKATTRVEQLVETDLMLAGRQAEHDEMDALGVHEYRRVLRPELSKTGSCGLCVVASDRIYTVRDLLPIHGRCNCKTLPIIGEDDPGRSLNEEDLKKLYKAAGSTSGDDLKRVRVQVNEHGELGPVLTNRSDSFRGPKDVPLEQDPERAKRMLDKAQPVLDGLEKRAAAGEDVTGPLQYQRDLADRLRRIVDGH